MTEPTTPATPARVRGLQRNKPIPAGFVAIEHPGIVDDDGNTVPTRVNRKALPHWEARGWREVQDPAAEQPAAPDPQTPAGTQLAASAAATDAAAVEDKPRTSRRGAPTGMES